MLTYPNIPPILRAQFGELFRTFRNETGYSRIQNLSRIEIAHRLWEGEIATAPFINPSTNQLSFYQTSNPLQNLAYKNGFQPNYFKGDGMKLIGAISLPPGMKIKIDDEDNPDQIELQSIATEVANRLHRQWNLPSIVPRIMQAFWERANVFLYTPLVVNQNKYGTSKVPNLTPQPTMIQPAHYECHNCGGMVPAPLPIPICPQCNTPFNPDDFREAIMGMMKKPDPANPYTTYANASPELYLEDSLSVITSYDISKFDEASWLCYEKDEYAGALISSYQWLQGSDARTTFSASGQDDVQDYYSRMIRHKNFHQSRNQPINQSHIWRRTRWFLEPEQYETVDLKTSIVAGGKSYSRLADFLRDQYPNGVKSTLINGHLGQIESASLHSQWTGAGPSVGYGFYQKNLGEEHINASRYINDLVSIMMSTAQKGSPLVFYDEGLFNLEEIVDKPQLVREFIRVNPAFGKSLKDYIFQTQPAELSPVVTALHELIVQTMRDCSNIHQSLWGATPPEQTLGATELKKNQAMQPHQIPWNNTCYLLARAMDNAIAIAARAATDDGILYFSPRRGHIERYQNPGVKKLLQGGFGAIFDERIPMSWGAQQGQLFEALKLDPMTSQQILGLSDIANVQTIQEAVGGVDKIKIPGYQGKQKAMRMIKMLMQQPGIQDPTGLWQPSIPIDIFEDDHMLMATAVREWSQSDKALNLRAAGSEPNYQNVMAWGRDHLLVAMGLPPGQPLPLMPSGPFAAAPGAAPPPGPPPSGGPSGPPSGPDGPDAGPPSPESKNPQSPESSGR